MHTFAIVAFFVLSFSRAFDSGKRNLYAVAGFLLHFELLARICPAHQGLNLVFQRHIRCNLGHVDVDEVHQLLLGDGTLSVLLQIPLEHIGDRLPNQLG